jgi:hypothetical protein
MKLSRLLAYAAAGMVAGLIIENQVLISKQFAAAKARLAKKKLQKLEDKILA